MWPLIWTKLNLMFKKKYSWEQSWRKYTNALKANNRNKKKVASAKRMGLQELMLEITQKQIVSMWFQILPCWTKRREQSSAVHECRERMVTGCSATHEVQCDSVETKLKGYGRNACCSELHGVWCVALGQGEACAEILLHHIVLNVLQQGAVNVFLQLLAGVRCFFLWGLLGEELVRSGWLCALLLESIVGDRVKSYALEVNLSGCGHSVNLVDSLDGNAVNLEWAGNCEQTGL